MQDLGNLKKIVCTAGVEEKKLASTQLRVEKYFLPPRNHDTPRPRGNNGPSLTCGQPFDLPCSCGHDAMSSIGSIGSLVALYPREDPIVIELGSVTVSI